MRNKHRQKTGFSLIEIVISVALFVLIILSTTDIFRLVIASQRKAIAAQNIQESLKYFLETADKEIRTAKKNNGWCTGTSGVTFTFPGGANDIYAIETAPNGTGNALIFRNYYDECVIYYLGNSNDGMTGRFMVQRFKGDVYQATIALPISPAKVSISNLNLILSSVGPAARPMVTMGLSAQTLSGNNVLASMNIQTSLTSRFYR